MAPRDGILRELADAGVPAEMLELLRCIMQQNRVWVDDGIRVVGTVNQTTGVAQGDGLSPLLFSMLLSRLPGVIQRDWTREWVRVIMYADDIAIVGRSLFRVKQALGKLMAFTEKAGLTINWQKTVAMKFRRGGILAKKDVIEVRGQGVSFVNKFTYLGVTMPTNGKSFRTHLRERTAKAIRAASSIRDPQKLSIGTAEALFRLKIAPIASYGIQLVWERLGEEEFRLMDRVKAFFMKRVMGLAASCKNRIVWILLGGRLWTEVMQARGGLARTGAFERYLANEGAKL